MTEASSETPRLLAVDLDGTLLREDESIAPEDIDAIGRLRDSGVRVTIATGRLYSGTKPTAQVLEIVDEVACMNGAELVHVGRDERSVRHGVPAEVRSIVHQRLRDIDVRPALFSSDEIRYGSDSQMFAPYFSMWSRRVAEVPNLLADPLWASGPELLSIVGVGMKDVVFQAAEDLDRTPIVDVCEVYRVAPPQLHGLGVLVVRDTRSNKGSALENLAALRGLRIEDCVCVGDETNDLPMLRTKALGFAMGESVEAVQNAADVVLNAPRGKGGGIAELIDRVWGI